MLSAAEKFVNRQTSHLALEVPKRCFDAAQHYDAEAHAAPKMRAMVHPIPKLRDAVKPLAHENGPKEFNDARNQLGTEIARIGFANANQLGVRQYFDEGGTAAFAGLAQKGIVGA